MERFSVNMNKRLVIIKTLAEFPGRICIYNSEVGADLWFYGRHLNMRYFCINFSCCLRSLLSHWFNVLHEIWRVLVGSV